ncbi:MAG TPA: hypothetical protein VKO45_08835 [Methanomicrobiales archaeon]|nr:hypothetical protein [Methanomicrobiales archaeon]
MITVTTSRRADPLVRRIGRDFAFATGGTYVTRGKGGLSRPPFSGGIVLVLSRDGKGIRTQILSGSEDAAILRFPEVREESRAGPLRKGLFTGDRELFSTLSPLLPVSLEGDLPDTVVLDGIQGRRISLLVPGEA